MALSLYFVLILTHERFVGLNLFFLVYFLFNNNYRFKSQLIYTVSFSIPTIILFSLKSLILHIPIFVGTGTAWGVGFSITTAIQFLGMLVIGLLGANVGLEYLHGYTLQVQGLLFQVISISLMLVTLKNMCNGIPKFDLGLQRTRPRYFLTLFIVLASLFLSLAIPIVSTIRIESRWYFPLYIIFLFLLLSRFHLKSNLYKSKSKRPTRQSKSIRNRSIWLLLFFLGNLSMNIVYTQKLDALYFVRTQDVVSSQINSALPHLLISKKNQSRVYLLDRIGGFDVNSFNSALNANTNFTKITVKLINDLSEIQEYSSDDVILEPDNKSYDAGFRIFDSVKNSVVIYGNYYDDLWAGKLIKIVSEPVFCKKVEVTVLPSSWKGAFYVKVGQTYTKYEIDDSIVYLNYPVSAGKNELTINFTKTFVPYSLGLNDDRRELSHRIQARCLN
jgi:hypothetical protein